MAGRKLESYVRKYGEVEGRKMLSRMQKISGLASAHAKQKKRLEGEG